MMRIALALAITLAGAASLHAAPAGGVQVREENGTYVVTAQFEVAAGPAVVLRVLSDYERIPEFAPGVTRSIVKDRQGSHAVVEQEAVPRVLMFSKRLHLVLDIQEDTTSITFHDICGRSFSTYAGSWHVRSSETGSTVTYTLSAKPSFGVPQFVLGRLLKKDSTEMIANLRREIERQ